MMSRGIVATTLALACLTLFSATASAAEVSKYRFSGPSASARFHRVTAVLCDSGNMAAIDDTIHVSAAKWRERVDGEPSPDFPAYVTIFSFDGCSGTLSFGSADLEAVRYSQATVQRARLSGRASVTDFNTGQSLGDIRVDMVLDGVGPIASDGGHLTTEYDNVRLIEVWQGKTRSATFSGSVTLDGQELAPYFEAPIGALANGHYVSTMLTF
jgi:hypothetical protein